jgi:hypothetical protein
MRMFSLHHLSSLGHIAPCVAMRAGGTKIVPCLEQWMRLFLSLVILACGGFGMTSRVLADTTPPDLSIVFSKVTTADPVLNGQVWVNLMVLKNKGPGIATNVVLTNLFSLPVCALQQWDGDFVGEYGQ